MREQSAAWFERAKKVIPGGVNSPVRAFNSVGGTPVFVESAAGTKMRSVDGREYLDFCCSWGPLILGHAHPDIVQAVQEACALGLSFGASTPGETLLAEKIVELIPYVDEVRMVSSGTEAAMTGLRLARGATGRDKVIKFEGCYHGHSDAFLVAAGSGLLTGGISASAGVPAGAVEDVFLTPYNDLDAVRKIVEAHGDELAAIVLEPIAGNMGFVRPDPGFLEGLRELTTSCDAMLLFDEVITGFRLGPTTCGNLVGVTPDVTCLGKIVGGGMPLGAIAAKREIMEQLSPCGPVYQAGTLSGNPVAVTAGLKTLELLQQLNPYPAIAERGERLRARLNEIAEEVDYDFHCAGDGGVFTVFFTAGPCRNLTDVKACDLDRFARFFHGMLDAGFYLPPSQFEAGFVSAVHTDAEVEAFLVAAETVLKGL